MIYYQDSHVSILHGDNLDVLGELLRDGEKFDLVECDGPYSTTGKGLEDWDTLTEDQYVEHYAARLGLVRDVLQPWGVVFVFGYPEGCAEIKAWARQSGTLHLRRWLTWYKQRTAHKGRKVETIALFETPKPTPLFDAFKIDLRQRRKALGLTVKDAMIDLDINAFAVTGANAGERGGGGWLWFEAESSRLPDPSEYAKLADRFALPSCYETLQSIISLDGITNLDFLSATYPEDTRDLNDAGLRSKPVGLYSDLFRPVVPPREDKRALVLYGGSGNAAIAAGLLGYQVTVVEQDATRCELIRRRWDWALNHRDNTLATEYGPLFQEVTQ